LEGLKKLEKLKKMEEEREKEKEEEGKERWYRKIRRQEIDGKKKGNGKAEGIRKANKKEMKMFHIIKNYCCWGFWGWEEGVGVEKEVLGLDGDVHLSPVKSLDSSVRKIWFNTFVLFNFLFFLW
jgi:hypothetical protein